MLMKLKFIMPIVFNVLLILCITNVQAGNNKEASGKITVFTEAGEKFTLYVNGIKQNTVPAAKMEVKDVKGLTLKINAVFENPALAPVAKTIVRMAKDCSYSIAKNKKGQYEINMKSAGTLGTPASSSPTAVVDKTDSIVQATMNKTDSMVNKQPLVPIPPTPSGTTTLAQTDPSKSQVMVNGRPADASVKVDNSTGKITLGATNDKGEGAKITIDPNKLGDLKNGFHEPEVKVGGMTTDEYATTMDKTGDAIGNSFDSQFNNTPRSVTPPASNNISQTDPASVSTDMATRQKETQDAATTAMNSAANHGPILPGTFTFSSENGEKFTVFMDNVKQNTTPLSTVVVNNVLSSTLRSKIVFEDTAIPAIEKKGIRMWRNYSFVITKNKKGEYVLKASGKDDLYGR